MSKASAYIITKPLQYINARNISDKAEIKDCFLISYFLGASDFCDYLSRHTKDFWYSVELYNSRYKALIYIIKNRKRYSRIYLDSDYGILLTFFLFFLRKHEIYTYEEGFGSYRYLSDTETGFKSKVTLWLRKMLNNKNWMGGNRFVKGMFVYHPEVLIKLIPESSKKDIQKLSTSFYSCVNQLKEMDFFYSSVNIDKYQDKTVFIYLTTWNINEKYKKYLKEFDCDYAILKPHPHIQTLLTLDEFDETITEIPSEILIVKIASKAKKLIVIHENSSTMIYLLANNLSNMTEINISDNESFSYTRIKDSIESTLANNIQIP